MINQETSQDFIEIGSCLTMFCVANLMTEGLTMGATGWQKISDEAAKEVEKLTGMPAEDFAGLVEPLLKTIKDEIRKAAE